MGNFLDHSRIPGAPPPGRGPTRLGGIIRPDEIVAIPCAGCSCVFRREVFAMKHVRHRITQEIGESRQKWWLCLGCDAQVDNKGALVAIDSDDRIPAEVLKEALRGK